MIYRQTINVERIILSPLDNIDSMQLIELVKYGDVPMFAVYMDDGNDEWLWEFEMSDPSDYERVKMNVFDAIFECDTMDELVDALNAIFEDGFGEILIYEEDDDEVEWEDEDVKEDNFPYCNCPNCRRYRQEHSC